MGSRWYPRVGSADFGGGGVLAGDVTGPLLANTVVALQGSPIDPAAPGAGDHLVFDGVDWTPTPGAATVGAVCSAPGAWTVPIAVAVGDVVYGTGAFTADTADNGSVATMPAIGVVIAKPIATTATVCYLGETAVFVGLTAGAEYFVGLAGAITLTAPGSPGDVVQRVGVAANSTTLLLIPSPVTVLA